MPLHVSVKVVLGGLDQRRIVVDTEPVVEIHVVVSPRSTDHDATVRSRDQVVVFPVVEAEDVAVG